MWLRLGRRWRRCWKVPTRCGCRRRSSASSSGCSPQNGWREMASCFPGRRLAWWCRTVRWRRRAAGLTRSIGLIGWSLKGDWDRWPLPSSGIQGRKSRNNWKQTGKWNKGMFGRPFSGDPRNASDEQAVRIRHLPQSVWKGTGTFRLIGTETERAQSPQQVDSADERQQMTTSTTQEWIGKWDDVSI